MLHKGRISKNDMENVVMKRINAYHSAFLVGVYEGLQLTIPMFLSWQCLYIHPTNATVKLIHKSTRLNDWSIFMDTQHETRIFKDW